MFRVDGKEYEDIDDYIMYNEEINEDEVICPYCKEKVYLEPYARYEDRTYEEWECEHCGRKFKLSAEMTWNYTATPIEEEIEKIKEEDIEDVED